MAFKRDWDGSCPQVWDTWESDGKSWVIQDLRPEDDELALDIIFEDYVPEETIAVNVGLPDDEESIEEVRFIWTLVLEQRASLGCYKVENGEKTLVALNICIVHIKSEDKDEKKTLLSKVTGKATLEQFKIIEYISKLSDTYNVLGVDKYLGGAGLVVKKDFRGMKLGDRILNAREPFCRHLGIKATSSIFTGPASQKTAERCGFITHREFTFKELKEQGFSGYTDDETKALKTMNKKYEY